MSRGNLTFTAPHSNHLHCARPLAPDGYVSRNTNVYVTINSEILSHVGTLNVEASDINGEKSGGCDGLVERRCIGPLPVAVKSSETPISKSAALTMAQCTAVAPSRRSPQIFGRKAIGIANWKIQSTRTLLDSVR